MVLASKPDDLSSIPWTHVVEGISFYRCPFSDLHTLPKAMYQTKERRPGA